MEGRAPLFLTLGVGLFFGFLSLLGFLDGLENGWRDFLFKMRGMEKGDPRVNIVTIDDESIDQVGQYPWPRRFHAQLIERLLEVGVEVIGYDVLFFDRSPSPADDQALVESTRKAGVRLVHAMDLDTSVPGVYELRPPFPALAKAARNTGLVSQVADPDGSVRTVILIIGSDRFSPDTWGEDPKRKPSLSLAVLSQFQKRPAEDFLPDRKNPFLVLNVRGEKEKTAGQYKDTKTGKVIEVKQSEYGFRRVSAWRVLGRKLDAAERKALKGSIALVGSTAKATFDHYPTPFSPAAPGVEVHANALDNLLNQRAFRPVSQMWTLALLFAMAFGAMGLVRLSPAVASAGAVALLAAWSGASCWSFSRLKFLDFVGPALSLGVTFVGLIVRRTFYEQREKRYIKNLFGQFVAPEVVDDLARDPSKVRLGGDKREMTVFFLDIAHFTNISEKMDPVGLIQFLNKYLSALSECVHSHKGVVDKYVGDCIMAFWNAPLDQPDHRSLACLAAADCISALAVLNKDVDPRLPEKPAVRIGINSGPMVVGLTGSQKKLQYTVIGDEVNLASRLEGANKFFGSKIMVSEATYQGARDAVEVRVLGQVRVVGKEVPIKVYELLGKKGELSDGWGRALPLYEEGVQHFLSRRYEKAMAAFEGVRKIFPTDGPSDLYLKASRDYAAIPPPADWDGVFNLTAK